MSFQIKDFRSIITSMINVARASGGPITDFSVGSVTRTMMEAPAAEIEELYLQMLLGLQDAIPVAIYQAFGFDRLEALPALGLVRFSAASPPESNVLIPAGTVVKSPSAGVSYATQADITLLAGDTVVDVLAASTAPGAAGNVPIGSISEIVNQVAGVDAVTNLLPFSSGQDAETDAQRKTRFISYISTLSKGTPSALRYGASMVALTGPQGDVSERVAHVEVIEPYLTNASLPVGQVLVYVHNGVGSTSPELVTKVAQVLAGYRGTDGLWVPGWKSAGVQMTVLACPEILVNVTADIDFGSGSTSVLDAAAAVRSYISGVPVGGSVLRAELISRFMQLPGVLNVTLTAPVSDVTVQAHQKAMPGTVVLT